LATQYTWDGPVSMDQKEYIIQSILNGLEDLDYDFKDIRKQVDSTLVEKIETIEEEGEKPEEELTDDELRNAQKQVSFSRNIYSNLLKQPKFRSLARKVMTSSREIEPRNKIKNRSRKNENHYGYAYGIKKVVLVSPLYWKFDARYDLKLERLKSDEKSREISTIISDMSDKLDIELEVLDPKKFNPQDVEKFNLYTELVEWQTDYFNNDEEYAIMMTQPYGEKFSELYDTEIFLWVFIENIKVRNQTSLGSMLYFFSVVGIPFVVYDMFAPDFRTNIYLYAMNIETGQEVHKQIISTRTLDRKDILNGNIYQLLYELNRRR